MVDMSLEECREVLELSPAERDERGVTDTDVQSAFVELVARGDETDKVFEGCTLPALVLDYRTLDSADKHPVVFRDCSLPDGVSAVGVDVQLPVRFEDCTVGNIDLESARFGYDIAMPGTTVTGEVDAFEARFEQDATFADATFRAPVSMDEASFGDDTSFDGATFAAEASFRAATFAGSSNELDDNASFEGATFEAEASFRHATFGYASFEGATFEGKAAFEEVAFDGDAAFADTTVHGEADFDEARFGEDVSFEGSRFAGDAVFRGARFEGGARTLEDNARFADVAFEGDANFRDAQFRYVNFERATFENRAMFEEARFDGDADFGDTDFAGEADFDEARFDGDADFRSARFEQPAVFRGAIFEGEAQHLEKNAVFADVLFTADVDFDNAYFNSANFRGTEFGGIVDFSGATFADEIEFLAEAIEGDTYVDFTDAVLKEGSITQPTEQWLRYDFTRASLGDVALKAARKGGDRVILDYFRFCNTEFDEFDGYEFDFSEHTYYFDRNEWKLHTFVEADRDYEFALEMTPENVETTYLKAKKAASAGGYVLAAGEFRVKRQRHARRKHLAIAADAQEDRRTRLSNAGRAVENYFLDLSCGYGMRLGRILAVFLLVPLGPALLYAFGGPEFRTGAGQLSSLGALATPEGQAIMFENLHFSYITFLTIGYGNFGPKGAFARMLAGLEVYTSVVLGGLVLYALIKRSEL